MDTNGVLDNVIVKQKVISSSKLKSINLKQSFVKDSPADLTSVENQIAAISFSQKSFNNTATNAKFQRRLDLNLTNNSFNANASKMLLVYFILWFLINLKLFSMY